MKAVPSFPAKRPAAAKPSPNAGKKKVEFVVAGRKASDVFVAGTFNGWQTLALEPKGGPKAKEKQFSRVVYLPPGQYQYKFIIDGEWILDPNCPSLVSNEFGTHNSILQVG